MKANYKKLLSFGAIALATIVTSMSGSAFASEGTQDPGTLDHVYDKVQSVVWEAEEGIPTGKVTITYECSKEGHTADSDGDYFTKEEVLTGTLQMEGKDFECTDHYTRYKATDKNGKVHYSDPVETFVGDPEKHVKETTIESKKATCKDDGYIHTVVKCKNCEVILEEKTETVAADPEAHVYVTKYEPGSNVEEINGVFVLKDYTRDGIYYEIKTCSICGDVVTEEKKILASEMTEGATVYEHINTNESKMGTTDDGKEYNTVDNTWIYQDEKGNWSAGLYDCSKAGKYAIVTYNGGVNPATGERVKGVNQIDYKEKTIEAGTHTKDDPKLGNVSSKSITVKNPSNEDAAKWDYIKYVDGKAVVTNGSCKDEGWFEEVITCCNPKCNLKGHKEIETKKVTVPVSDKHPAVVAAKDAYDDKTEAEKADQYILENITGECETGLYRDVYTKCAVCGRKVEFVKNEKFKVGHTPSKAVMDPETYVAPTQHHDGYYESVVTCTVCGKELSRTEVVVPADPKTKYLYNFTYTIQWPNYKYFVGNEADRRLKNNEDAYALLIARPTDDDLTENEKQEIASNYTVVLEGVEDTDKAVKGNTCKLGERTFTVTVTKKNARNLINKIKDHVNDRDNMVTVEELMKMTDTQAFNWDDGYKGGHKWGKAVTEEKDGKVITRRTCTLCGEVEEEVTEKETEEEVVVVKPTSIKKAVIEGTAQFRGEYFNVPFTVTLNGKKLTENKDFVLTNARKNNFRSVGSHTIKIAGIGNYTGTAKGKLTITKADQNIKMSKTKKTFKASTLKKKAASFITTITNAHGKLSYKTSSKKITFKKQAVGTYKVTAKKGTKAGTYTITINFATSKNYNAAQKKITITVK